MADIKLICTVVPNPYRTAKTNKPSFSLCITPKIQTNGQLNRWQAVLKWTSFLDLLQANKDLKVVLGKQTLAGNTYTMKNEFKVCKISWDKGQLLADYFKNDEGKLNSRYKDVRERLWSKLVKPDYRADAFTINETGDPVKPVLPFAMESLKLEQKSIMMQLEAAQIEANDDKKNGKKTLFEIDSKYIEATEKLIQQANKKERTEFHKLLSMITGYPHMARMLGWIVDFAIDEDFDPSFNIIKMDLNSLAAFVKAKADAEAPFWTVFRQTMEFRLPWTYFEKEGKKITPKYAELFAKDYYVVKNGFIRNSGIAVNSYTITADQYQNAITNEKNNLKPNDVVAFSSDKNPSTGIALKLNFPLLTKIIQNDPLAYNKDVIVLKDYNGKVLNAGLGNIDNFIMFGHHLDIGYRIDVAILENGKEPAVGEIDKDFESLCLRTATYVIDKSPNPTSADDLKLFDLVEDEPWIEENIQIENNRPEVTNPEICRWNNWSLTCPHNGEYKIEDETPNDSVALYNDIELRNALPKEGTLTPLRFGKKYKFRLRSVDICGNSPDRTDKIFDKDFIILSKPYKRMERISPPEIHFRKLIYEKNNKNQRVVIPNFEGENLFTLVIKTRIKTNGTLLLSDSCDRALAPPRVATSFVELHGVIDSLLKDKDNRFLVYEKASYVKLSEEEELFKLNEEIPFLSDPCTTGVNIRIDQLPSQDLINIWPEADLAYIGRKFGGLTLQHPDGSQKTRLELSTDQRNLKIHLKAGGVLQGQIKTLASTNPAKYFEVDNGDKTIFDDNKDTDSVKEILLIHAVQRPMLINDQNDAATFKEEYHLTSFQPQKRVPKEVKARLELNLKEDETLIFPFATTGDLFLNAYWDEVITDLNDNKGFRIEKTNLSIPISNVAVNDNAKDPFKFPKLKYEKDMVVGNETEIKRMLQAFQNFTHEFKDTKFRKVSYELVAESRFKQYFPEAESFAVKGILSKPLMIKNTEQCPQLHIDSITPVFNWTISNDFVTRRQNMVRIYFNGDWFLTGAQEQVSILYLKNSNTIKDECEGMVSGFGKDATTFTTGDFNMAAKPLTEDFFLTLDHDNKLVRAEVVASDSIDLRILDRAASNFIQPVAGKADFPTCASLYNPKFDTRRKKFYIDVYIAEDATKDNYWPFLKLALSRYQGNSIMEKGLYDYRFSSITMAPKIPLLPSRTVDVKNKRFVLDNILTNNYWSRTLEFYLIIETNSTKDLANLVEDGVIVPAVAIRLDQLKDGRLSYRKTNEEIKDIIKKFNVKRIFIEEFEVYEKEDFNIKTAIDPELGCPLNYSPREDIRKRLVFSYLFD